MGDVIDRQDFFSDLQKRVEESRHKYNIVKNVEALQAALEKIQTNFKNIGIELIKANESLEESRQKLIESKKKHEAIQEKIRLIEEGKIKV